MDINAVTSLARPRSEADAIKIAASATSGDAWLAGGTWLFSEPQPRVRRLIDLGGLDWKALEADADGLRIAATCTVAALAAFDPPETWRAAKLFGQCCQSFLASFKIWNMATVGGNICMALPAGPMISLGVALEGQCVILTADGRLRRTPIADFIQGPQRPALNRGELLRRIDLPREALMRRTAFRRISLTALGRSAALLIGTLSAQDDLILTVTAATRRPVRLAFSGLPDEAEVLARIEAEIPDSLYYDDIHGAPAWRKHMTREFACEIRQELSCGASA
jgi:CO/xanthine dehydrogenase FAD-binding subunit